VLGVRGRSWRCLGFWLAAGPGRYLAWSPGGTGRWRRLTARLRFAEQGLQLFCRGSQQRAYGARRLDRVSLHIHSGPSDLHQSAVSENLAGIGDGERADSPAEATGIGAHAAAGCFPGDGDRVDRLAGARISCSSA
jgi:hypothetical protein